MESFSTTEAAFAPIIKAGSAAQLSIDRTVKGWAVNNCEERGKFINRSDSIHESFFFQGAIVKYSSDVFLFAHIAYKFNSRSQVGGWLDHSVVEVHLVVLEPLSS